MSFFSQFPLTQITIGNDPKRIIDLFRHVDVNDILADNITNYTTISIGDGERPDNLSQRLYGTPDYYWTFFIINENLKKGLDDWPKSFTAIEKEFQNEYDNISTFTIKPERANQLSSADGGLEEDGDTLQVNYDHISNTLAGLDLTYESLKIFRNFSTASIVKYDDNEMQLYLDNFSNRNRFMLDPHNPTERLAIEAIEYENWEDGTGLQRMQPDNCDGTMSFWFDDWPILGGDNRENTKRQGDGINHTSRGQYYLNTMTAERHDWMVSLFKWYDSLIIGSKSVTQDNARAQMPYRKYLNDRASKGEKQAALDTFLYFTPWPKTGEMKWKGIKPFKRTSDQREHSFLTARNAPCYYYKSGGEPFVQEDIINAYDMLNGIIDPTQYDEVNKIYNTIGQDPLNYVTHYQKAIALNDSRSLIKVIKPELIVDFAAEFRKKLNSGLTRTSIQPATREGLGNAAEGGSVGGSQPIATGTVSGGGGGGGTTGGGSSY